MTFTRVCRIQGFMAKGTAGVITDAFYRWYAKRNPKVLVTVRVIFI